jgi:hypothetical protein
LLAAGSIVDMQSSLQVEELLKVQHFPLSPSLEPILPPFESDRADAFAYMGDDDIAEPWKRCNLNSPEDLLAKLKAHVNELTGVEHAQLGKNQATMLNIVLIKLYYCVAGHSASDSFMSSVFLATKLQKTAVRRIASNWLVPMW